MHPHHPAPVSAIIVALAALVCMGLFTPAAIARHHSPRASASPADAPASAPAPSASPSAGGPALPPEAAEAAAAGILAMSKDNFDVAERAFLKLLALSPENPNALVNLGLVEFRLGRPDQAQTYLQHAIRLRPDTSAAWLTLGLIHHNQGDLVAATADIAQAVLLDPKNPRAHNYFAAMLSRRGWYSGAEEELQKAVELDPTFADAHFNLALTYLERTPPAVELARRHYEKALDLGAPRDPSIDARLKQPADTAISLP